MITVKIGGTTFLCNTPQEAIQLHRLATNVSSTAAVSIHAAASAAPAPAAHVQDGPAMQFLETLKPYAGRDVDAPTLAKLLDTSSTGVGPRLASYRRQLEALPQPVMLNDYLSPRKNPDGTTLWAVRFSSTGKST